MRILPHRERGFHWPSALDWPVARRPALRVTRWLLLSQLSCFRLPKQARILLQRTPLLFSSATLLLARRITVTTTEFSETLTLETMNLFDTVLASLNDPSRETQMSDLDKLSSAFGSGGSSTNQIASLLGGFLKPMLREQQAVAGPEGVDSLLQELKQSAHSPDQLRQVIGSERMDQMVGQAEQKTGLDANSILRLLPIVLPAIIGLFQSGRPTAASSAAGAPREASLPSGTGAAGAQTGAQTNPILSQFLDSDGDGDVDMQDLVRLTSVFLRK